MSNSIKQQKTYITILNYLTDQLEKKRENNDYIHWNIYNLKLAYGENDSSLNPQKGEFRDQEDDYDILCTLNNSEGTDCMRTRCCRNLIFPLE